MRTATIDFRPHARRKTAAVSRAPATCLAATAVLAATCVYAAHSSALAEDYCVTCSEPAATYRCRIEGIMAGGEGGHQFSCIKDIAQRAGHASCTVSRGAGPECAGRDWTVLQDTTAANSPDARAAVPQSPSVQHGTITAPNAAVQAPSSPPASEQARALPQAAASAATQAPLKAATGAAEHYVPPRATARQETPEGQRAAPMDMEANKRDISRKADATGAIGEAAGKAGNAISGAAKKTWDCVSSLFSKC